jgi:hypothetical protein
MDVPRWKDLVVPEEWDRRSRIRNGLTTAAGRKQL